MRGRKYPEDNMLGACSTGIKEFYAQIAKLDIHGQAVHTNAVFALIMYRKLSLSC